MAQKKRHKISADGRKRISRAMKKRWALARKHEHLSLTPPSNASEAKAEIDSALIAAAFGYISHTIEEFARRARVPSAVLAERVGEILLESSKR